MNKRVLIIFTFFIIYVTDITLAGFLECSQSSDCEVPTALCENNLCKCPIGEVFNEEGTRCLAISIGLNSDCEVNEQCAWLLGHHQCYEKKCVCAEGWRYNEGRCVKPVGLKEACKFDRECVNDYDILAMICKEGTCQCNKGYYARGDYDCRPETTELEKDNYCSLHSDCKIENATCIGSRCQIAPSQYIMQDVEYPEVALINIRAVSELDCITNDDCSVQPNTYCYSFTKKCICRRGFISMGEYGCIPELGTYIGCVSDEDCPITPGRCIEGKCYCRKTYFTSKSNNACQKPATHDNLFCNNNERCHIFGTEVSCASKKCKCLDTAELDENLVCVPKDDGGVTLPPGGCNSDQQCHSSVTNSLCINSQCECPKNYREEKKACLPNIGAACDDIDKLCTIEHTSCAENSMCACDGNYVEHGQLECLIQSTGLEGRCQIDQQCLQVIANSRCVDSICECQKNFVVHNGTCHHQKVMGDACSKGSECHIMLSRNVQCRNSKCQCPADERPTVDNLDCEKLKSNGLILANNYRNMILVLMGYVGVKVLM